MESREKRKNLLALVSIVIISCLIMALVETIIEPTYAIKSMSKILFFFLIPIIFIKGLKIESLSKVFYLDKEDIAKLVILGLSIYVVIMGAYFFTRQVFDYENLVTSLMTDQQVAQDRFIGISLYISLANSFLEEFMFRLIAFILLRKYISKTAAHLFSASMFAIYHIGMIGKSFPVHLIILSLIGLFVGGLIFNYVDDKDDSIFNSWIIHMFADFALVTIWYINI